MKLTVDELIASLTKISESGGGNLVPVISYDTGRASIGGTPATALTGVHVGFDWNAGKVFLQTEQPLGVADEALKQLGKRADDLAAEVYILQRKLLVGTQPMSAAESSHAAKTHTVNAMCMTMRHDYGLDKPAEGLGAGMTPQERRALFNQMHQLYEHHIEPFVASLEILRNSTEDQADTSWLSLLRIAHLAIIYRQAETITEARIRSEDFWKNADAADADEVDLEETLAMLRLFSFIDEVLKSKDHENEQEVV